MRVIGEGIKMTLDEAQQIFDGVMLGDATIKEVWSKRSVNPTRVFAYAQTGSDHNDSVLRVRGALIMLGVDVSEMKPYKEIGLTAGYYCGFHSHSCPYIVSQCARWYMDRVKVIPSGLRITPLSLAQFYMDDGLSSYDKRNDAVVARLSSCGFSESENIVLINLLHDMGIEATKAHDSGKPLISIRQESIDTFMDIVEPYITESFRYKIKRRGTYEPVTYDFGPLRDKLIQLRGGATS
jgi:hypothetical protein